MPKSIENFALLIIAIFLCCGYMTGSDWYNYEQYYTNPDYSKQLAKLEFGYVWVQTFFSKIGVDFWLFHIAAKLLVFYALVSFIRSFNVNIFLFLAFFIPEVGFYLFIDCPFRNLIALGFSFIAFKNLFENKTTNFFIFALIAMCFHLSAIIILIFYLLYKKNIKTHIVLLLAIVCYIVAYNTDFLISKVYIPLTKISPLIGERLKNYFLDPRYISEKINIGAFVRLFVLFILLLYKEIIISGDNKRQYVFNLSILFLLLYPFSITMKIFHRLSIFLAPFYILCISYMLKSFTIKVNKYILYTFFVLLYFKQTYSLVTDDYRYVPYTNYVCYCVKNDFPSIEYRHQYNPKHSPYKKHISNQKK
ncbi:MAG: EpsG family protein [Bacteroidales bacterium]|nr:EpsG family protein [Bacteroidales bacterium]